MKMRSVFYWGLALLAVNPSAVHGQTSTSPNTAKPQVQQETGPDSIGFSIESEMLTYKAVEQNSAMVACEVAQYLYGTSSQAALAKSPCPVKDSSNASGVVIVSSSSTILADFQVWRADMASMNALETRAASYCSSGKGTTSNVPLPLDFTPEGQALSLLHDTLGLFGTSESLSAVVGTVKDQALINAVARELKALNVPVLIPETYNPFSLGPAEYADSPYFTNFGALMDWRKACEQAKTHRGADVAEIDDILDRIASFVVATTGGVTTIHPSGEHAEDAIAPGTQIGAQQSASISASAPQNKSGTPEHPAQSSPTSPAPTSVGAVRDSTVDKTATAAPSASASVHFASVFTADGFAKALGFTSNGKGPSSRWQHILWLKALESGGSLAKAGNIFGSKVHFSGGAVASYALFSIDGNLDCSGNVYSFGGALRAKELLRSFEHAGSKPIPPAASSQSTCGSLP